MARRQDTTALATARLRKAGLSHATANRVMSARKRKTPVALYAVGGLGFALLGFGAYTAWSPWGSDNGAESAAATNVAAPAMPQATAQDIVISERTDTTLAFSTANVPAAQPAAQAPAPVIAPTPQLRPAAKIVATRDCVDDLQDIMARTVIGFDAGSTGINSDGRDTLQMLGIAVALMPDQRVSIRMGATHYRCWALLCVTARRSISLLRGTLTRLATRPAI